MPMDPVDRGEAREDTPERLKLGGARLDVKSRGEGWWWKTPSPPLPPPCPSPPIWPLLYAPPPCEAKCEAELRGASMGGDDEERRARRDVAPADPLPGGPVCRCAATAAAAFPASPCRRRACRAA